MKEKETILVRLSNLLLERKDDTGDNSYTAQLYKAGSVKILEKIKEEADELIEAGSADTIKNQEIIHEAADLWFHTMVLLAFKEINPWEILKELELTNCVDIKDNQYFRWDTPYHMPSGMGGDYATYVFFEDLGDSQAGNYEDDLVGHVTRLQNISNKYIQLELEPKAYDDYYRM